MISVALAEPVHEHRLPAWTYDDDYTGQEEWGVLSPAYAACENGTEQSPINIAFTEKLAHPALEMRYAPVTARIRLENHAVHADLESGARLLAEGQAYALETISFHTPSEHMIGDLFYPVEIQLLHRDMNGNKLIVAVFADLGLPNSAMASILGQAPEKPGKGGSVMLDPASLLPESRGYFAYRGSLTTPPCTEGVAWRILKQPITLSHEQLTALSARMGRNARLPQPIYMRTVEETP